MLRKYCGLLQVLTSRLKKNDPMRATIGFGISIRLLPQRHKRRCHSRLACFNKGPGAQHTSLCSWVPGLKAQELAEACSSELPRGLFFISEAAQAANVCPTLALPLDPRSPTATLSRTPTLNRGSLYKPETQDIVQKSEYMVNYNIPFYSHNYTSVRYCVITPSRSRYLM